MQKRMIEYQCSSLYIWISIFLIKINLLVLLLWILSETTEIPSCSFNKLSTIKNAWEISNYPKMSSTSSSNFYNLYSFTRFGNAWKWVSPLKLVCIESNACTPDALFPYNLLLREKHYVGRSAKWSYVEFLEMMMNRKRTMKNGIIGFNRQFQGKTVGEKVFVEKLSISCLEVSCHIPLLNVTL